MRYKLKLMVGAIALLLSVPAWGQQTRTGTLLGANSTPQTILTAVGANNDTSEIFYLSSAYDQANFTFRRVRAYGEAGQNDSVVVKFFLQGSQTGDFFAGRTQTIDSTAGITAIDTVYTSSGDFVGVSGTSNIFDAMPSGTTEIPWHRNFPYIRFILDGLAGADDTVAYKIDFSLITKAR